MPAQIIDGSAVAGGIRVELRKQTERLKGEGIVPRLAVVLVGEDPASASYVKAKGAAAEETGIAADIQRLPRER